MFKKWIFHFQRLFGEFTELLVARTEASNTRDSPRGFPLQRSPARGGDSTRPLPFKPTPAGRTSRERTDHGKHQFIGKGFYFTIKMQTGINTVSANANITAIFKYFCASRGEANTYKI